MRKFCSVATVAVSAVIGSHAAHAQTSRLPAVEANVGFAAFADEAPVEHFVVGAAPRFYVSPRVSIGPEFVYMIGPEYVRDIFLTGNIWFDFFDQPPSRINRFTPYLVGGVGVMFHRNFLFNEGAARWFHKETGFSGGLGLRVAVGDRWYIAPEIRLGSELHARLTAALGYRFGR